MRDGSAAGIRRVDAMQGLPDIRSVWRQRELLLGADPDEPGRDIVRETARLRCWREARAWGRRRPRRSGQARARGSGKADVFGAAP